MSDHQLPEIHISDRTRIRFECEPRGFTNTGEPIFSLYIILEHEGGRSELDDVLGIMQISDSQRKDLMVTLGKAGKDRDTFQARLRLIT